MEKNDSKVTYNSSKLEKSSYAFYLLGQNILYGASMSALMVFWQFVLGINVAAIGVIFLIARIFDAFNDPVLAGIVQRTKTKKGGKYKPWTLFSAFVLPIVTIIMFVNINKDQNLSQGVLIAYAVITYFIWGIVYTLCDVPIYSLSMSMEPDAKHRSTIILMGRMAASIAGVFTSFLYYGLITIFDANLGSVIIDGGHKTWAFSQTVSMTIISVVSMVAMSTIVIVKERNIQEDEKNEVTIKTMFKSVKQNKHLIQLIVSRLLIRTLGGVFIVIMPTLFLTIGAFDPMGIPNILWMSISGLTMGIAGVANVFWLMFLTKNVGKRKAVMINMTIGILITILSGILAVVAHYQMWVILVLTTGGLVVIGTPSTLNGIFTSDCIEYGHWKNGIRQEATAFSTLTLTTKMVNALGGFFGSMILTIVGIVVISESTPVDINAGPAMQAFWITLSLIIIAGIIGIILFKWFYTLDEKDVAEYAKINRTQNAKFEEATQNKVEVRKE